MITLAQSLSRALSLTLVGAALLGATAFAHDLHRETEVTGEVQSCRVNLFIDDSGAIVEDASITYRYATPRGERLGRGVRVAERCDHYRPGSAVSVIVSGDGRSSRLSGGYMQLLVVLLVSAVGAGYLMRRASTSLEVACSRWCAARASSIWRRVALAVALVLAGVAGGCAGSRSVPVLATVYALATVASLVVELIVAWCASTPEQEGRAEIGPYRTNPRETRSAATPSPEAYDIAGAVAAAAVVNLVHANGLGPSSVAVMVPTLLLAIAAAWRAL